MVQYKFYRKGGEKVHREFETLIQAIDTLSKRVETLEKQKNPFKIPKRWVEILFLTLCFTGSTLFCDYVLIPFISWFIYLF